MSDEENSSQGDAGSVVLADDFVIIQPDKKTYRRYWLYIVFAIAFAGIMLWFYYFISRPIIQIVPRSGELISSKVLPGIPAFLDNETLVFSRRASSSESQLIFKQFSQNYEEKSTKLHNKTEYLNPTMSPDVSKEQVLAWTLKQYNTPRIAIMPVNGSPALLTYGDCPSISKDGISIVFQRGENGLEEIWTMNFQAFLGEDSPNTPDSLEKLEQKKIDGSDQFILKGRRPDWSPARGEIAFESNETVKKTSILLVNVNKKQKPKNLTGGKETCTYPSFSPDGNLIMFSKKNGLWVMKRNGSKQKQILPGKKSETLTGRISPDGKRLAVWSGTNSEGKLRIYEIKYKQRRGRQEEVDIEKMIKSIESINESEKE